MINLSSLSQIFSSLTSQQLNTDFDRAGPRVPLDRLPNVPIRDIVTNQQTPAKIMGYTANNQAVIKIINNLFSSLLPLSLEKGTHLSLQIGQITQQAVKAEIVSVDGSPVQNHHQTINLTPFNAATKAPQLLNLPQQYPNIATMIEQVITGQLFPTPSTQNAPHMPILIKIIGFQLPTQGQESLPQMPILRSEGIQTNAMGQNIPIVAKVLHSNGQVMILETPIGHLRAPSPLELIPINTIINLHLAHIKRSSYTDSARISALLSRSPHSQLPLIENSWFSLNNILTVLNNIRPDLQQKLQNRLPNMGNTGLANLIIFTAILKYGRIQDFLGKNTYLTLEKAEQKKLLYDFNNDFVFMKKLTGENTSHTDWNLMLFPFFTGYSVRNIQMFVKKQKLKKRSPQDQDPINFLINCHLATLGKIQLDGYFLEKDKVLNISLRSYKPLDNKLKSNIRYTFKSNLTRIKWEGELSFVVNSSFPNEPMKEILPPIFENNAYYTLPK